MLLTNQISQPVAKFSVAFGLLFIFLLLPAFTSYLLLQRTSWSLVRRVSSGELEEMTATSWCKDRPNINATVSSTASVNSVNPPTYQHFEPRTGGLPP